MSTATAATLTNTPIIDAPADSSGTLAADITDSETEKNDGLIASAGEEGPAVSDATNVSQSDDQEGDHVQNTEPVHRVEEVADGAETVEVSDAEKTPSEHGPSSQTRKGATLVVVLRHGQTDANLHQWNPETKSFIYEWDSSWGEPLLNAQGVKDAERVKGFFESLVELLPEDFTYKVITSPSRRTVQTAVIALETTLLKTTDDVRRHACRSSLLCEVLMSEPINQKSKQEATNCLLGDETMEFIQMRCKAYGNQPLKVLRKMPPLSPERAHRMRALNSTTDISQQWQSEGPELEKQYEDYRTRLTTSYEVNPRLPYDHPFTNRPVVKPQGQPCRSWQFGTGHADVRGTEIRQLVSDLCVDLVVLVTHNRIAEFVDWSQQNLSTGGIHISTAHPLAPPAEPWNFQGLGLAEDGTKEYIRRYFEEHRNTGLVSKYAPDWLEGRNRESDLFKRLEEQEKAAQACALLGPKTAPIPPSQQRCQIVIYISYLSYKTWDPSFTVFQYVTPHNVSMMDLMAFENAKDKLGQVDWSRLCGRTLAGDGDEAPRSKPRVQIIVDSDALGAQAAVLALEDSVLKSSEDVANMMLRLPLSDSELDFWERVEQEEAKPIPDDMRDWLTPARQELLEAIERLPVSDAAMDKAVGDAGDKLKQAQAALHQLILKSDADVVLVVVPRMFSYAALPLYHEGVWTVVCKRFHDIRPSWAHFDFLKPFTRESPDIHLRRNWRSIDTVLEEFLKDVERA